MPNPGRHSLGSVGTLLRSLGQGHDLQSLGNGAQAFKYELGIVFAALQGEEGPT